MRSLADDLRARDDDRLCALVLARPDLIRPVPSDLTALAQRAGSPGSVAAALRDLDQFDLQVCLAACLAGDPIRNSLVTAAVTAAMVQVPGQQVRTLVRATMQRLRERALVWGSDRSRHVVGAARDLLVPSDRGPRMAGLDPVVARLAAGPESVGELLETAPPAARAALDRLLAGPVVGTVSDARRVPDPQRGGVDWLLAHHLVVPMGTGHVVVPAEVAAILRGAPSTDPVLAPISLVQPLPATPVGSAGDADRAAVAAVLDVLNLTADLGRLWSATPPGTVRAGGIASRDLARAARSLSVPPDLLRVLVEVAAAAGLIAVDAAADPSILPTASFDAWVGTAPPARHAALARAWLGMPREVARADQRPLSAELTAADAPAVRAAVLTALASAPGGWTDDELIGALAWRAPRRVDPVRRARAREVLDQLRALGLLVGGTLTSAGRALADADAAGLEVALRESLPAQVDQLVMQADLTAIVPGLPTPELERLLRVAAEPESTGVASVFRFSAGSVRRALDTGMAAAELSAALGRHGQVPQPLAYLIADIGRRHAVLRVGRAESFLRCDDPVELATLLADPRAASLGLHRLTDTVVTSQRPAEEVLDHLRRIGRSPQPEPGQGLDPPPRRARARFDEGTPPLSPALAAAAVRSMRAHDSPSGPLGDQPAAAAGAVPAPSRVPNCSPTEVVAALRAAITAQATVWLGYVEPTGVSADRRVEPLRLAAGYLTAFDLRTESIRSFAVARITGVGPG